MIFAKKYNIFYVSRETNNLEVNVSRETFITTKKKRFHVKRCLCGKLFHVKLCVIVAFLKLLHMRADIVWEDLFLIE